MKTLVLAAFAACSASGGILPGVIGSWKLVSAEPVQVTANRALWDEFGLAEAEQASYAARGQNLQVEAWRLADSTGAFGAFEMLRPADAKVDSKLAELTPETASTPGGGVVAVGNYLVRFTGPLPNADDTADLFRRLPRYEHAPLPSFTGYLPGKEAPNSEHYFEGPVGLKQYFPGIEAAQVAFHLGAEGVAADYSNGLKLALFSYPLPTIARDRAAALSQIPGALVKRSGPLVAVVLQPKDPNAAERLLSEVRYEAAVTTGEKPKTMKDNPGNLLMNIVFLIGILAGFCLVSGVFFGIIRVAFRRGGPTGEGEEILTLHLEER